MTDERLAKLQFHAVGTPKCSKCKEPFSMENIPEEEMKREIYYSQTCQSCGSHQTCYLVWVPHWVTWGLEDTIKANWV